MHFFRLFCVLLLTQLVAAIQTDVEKLTYQAQGTYSSSLVMEDLASAYDKLSTSVDIDFSKQNGQNAVLALTNFTVDFAATETFIPGDDILNIPTVVGSFVPMYNMILPRQLILSREIIVKIFLSQIIFWTDPAIVELNPTLDLPPVPIVTVIELVPSGMTKALTEAFTSISEEWANLYGVFDTFPLPFLTNPLFIPTQSYLTLTYIRAVPNSLGFVPYADLISQSLEGSFAHVVNRAGKVVTPSTVSVQAALTSYQFDNPESIGKVELNLADSNETLAWPFVAATYVQFHLLEKDPNESLEVHCAEVARLLKITEWMVKSYLGAVLSNKHGYVGSGTFLSAETFDAFVATLTCGGKPITLPGDSPIQGKGADYVHTSQLLSPYSAVSDTPNEQVWSPWFNELGSPIATSQAPSYQFTPVATSEYLDDYGHLVPTNDITPGFSFTKDRFEFNTSAGVSVQPSSSLWILAVATLAVLMGGKLRTVAMLLLFVFAMNQLLIPVEGVDFVMGCIYPLTGDEAVEGAQEEALLRLAIDDIRNNTDIALKPNHTLSYRVFDSESTETGSLAAVSKMGQVIAVISSHSSPTIRIMAPVIQSKELPHVCAASSEELSDPKLSLLVRIVSSDKFQGIALADFVVNYNWGRTVATLSTSDTYGSTIFDLFTRRLNHLGYSLLASQQFGSGSLDLWPYVSTVKESRARVIANFMPASDMKQVLRHAERLDMLHTSRYVWLCSDACANTDLYVLEGTNEQGGTQIDWKTRNRAEGIIGTRLRGGHGPKYETFLERWQSLDPQMYPGAGQPQLASFYAPYIYDGLYAYMYALLREVLQPTPSNEGTIRQLNSTDFVGLTGQVVMDITGKNRMPEYQIVNLPHMEESMLKKNEPIVSQTDFAHVGTWNILKGPEKLKIRKLINDSYIPGGLEGRIELNWAIQWGDGTSDTPNLDLRNSVDYWSCDDKQMKTDETGRSVRLDKPDGGNGNIADYYRCDEYIDCYNLSDEWGCAVSFPVTFIVYGIFIFLLLLFAILCLAFTCVFGFCIGRRRVRAASPVFLIIMTLSCILGYLGLFSFFGQPEQVSCGFRIWIIALSVVIMISALFAKSFRIWRLYRSPTEIKAMRDWKLIIFVGFLVLPVVILLVLWTGLATPGAELKKQNDDHEHFVCVTGGVAENAGSYTFFALIVAYIGLILLFGTFLSVVTRNVVSTFNESRLIAVSIYNLVFLGVVVIPIYFVLQDSGPLVAWIIIVTAVLYGLSATLFLQFLPKMYGVIIRDRFGDASGKSNSSSEGIKSDNLSKTLDSKAIW